VRSLDAASEMWTQGASVPSQLCNHTEVHLPMRDQFSSRPEHLRVLPTRADDERRPVIMLARTTGPEAPRTDVSTGVRVLIAEGEALVRAGYRALLESDELIKVVGEAASGQNAVLLAEETHPDVVLVDLGLPGVDVLETIERLSQTASAAVMLLAPHGNDERVLAALRAGAAGVLDKGQSAELIRAVQVLARGDGLLSVGLVRSLLEARSKPQLGRGPLPQQLDELTAREREVVALVARGLSNAEIAEQLVISPKTAKTHVSHAMVKVGARHRAQLVVLAYEAGLVVPEGSGPSDSDNGSSGAERMSVSAGTRASG
jgi:DNA-binding NarL/FixJ family response regulator